MGFVSDNLTMLSEIAKCIAEEVGDKCEVVLHDLTLPYDHTVVAIYNGHVTGRKVGDGGTNAGLAILQGTASPDDQYCYFNELPNGKILRTSSKYFKDSNGKVIGSLCINWDITDYLKMEDALGELSKMKSVLGQITGTASDPIVSSEYFSGNIDDLIDHMMTEALESTGKTKDALTTDDQIRIVKYLENKGFFLIQKSVVLLADFLNLSRYSIYKYMKEDR